jgi:hypothetical protein
MSRKERFGSRREGLQPAKSKSSYDEAEARSDGGALPPRRKKFPSSSQKVTKWYYNLLFFLFLCLVAGLFWYGLKFSD